MPRLAASLLVVAACSTSGDDAFDDAGSTPNVVDIAVQIVEIPGDLHALGLPVPARLFVPQFADGARPRPGLLVLHGSGGLSGMPGPDDPLCSPDLEPQFERWGRRLAELGYVALMPASF